MGMTMVLHFQRMYRISLFLKLQSNLIKFAIYLKIFDKLLWFYFDEHLIFSKLSLQQFLICKFKSDLLAASMLTETVNFSVFLPEALYLSG